MCEVAELDRSQYRLILELGEFGISSNLLDHFSFCVVHKGDMEISERIVLRYRDGPEVLLPPQLLFVDDSGQRWVRFKQTNYATCKLVLGKESQFGQ